MRLKAFASGTLSVFFLAADANAELPPNYKRAEEMTAVIQTVAEKLPTHTITKVIYQKPRHYQVIAGPCSLRAVIVKSSENKNRNNDRNIGVELLPQRCGR